MSQQQQSQLHSNINNSSGKQRNNGKGKFLTRSHAMHECTSPPQTPTPRTASAAAAVAVANAAAAATAAVTNSQSTVAPINDPTKGENNSKMSSLSPITVNATNNTIQSNAQQSSTTPNMFAPNGNLNVSQLDLEFPKLTPPKSKSPRNNNNVTNNNNNTQHSVAAVNSNSEHSSSNSNINNESTGDGNGINRECVNENAAGSAAVVPSQNSTDLSTKSSHMLDVVKGNTGNMVSCTILLNDVEKKCDLLLQGNKGNNQQNCVDENFSDKDKSNADESSNAAEFVYKKNRNSSVTKGGGGGSGKSRQKQNYGYDKSNSNNVGQSEPSQNVTSNGCQSDYYSMENSNTDHFTDQSGVDLLQFFKITLNKNAKDRYMLLRVEKELAALAQDQSRDVIKFPTMSSYNRMLIHRLAAWFGMEHNVDSTVQCVIVNTTKATRLPEIRFKSLLTDTFSDEAPSRKSILKRDAHSFEEYRQGLLACPDRGNLLDRKAKSFEEREQEYEKAKRRIFKDMNSESIEQFWQNWHSGDGLNANNSHKNSGKNINTDTTDDDHPHQHQHSHVNEGRLDGRPSVEKSHSFGGYGPPSQARIVRGDSVNSTKSAVLNKHDSNQQTWRLSPSSSGYKTQSQSLRSDSVTPSPSYGSGSHTPEPIQTVSSGIIWAVTDMASVPKGSVLLDPQTFKPLVNQDGSIYHFDPSNLPKLQIPNTSPANTPSPTLSVNENTNVPSRKKNHNKPINNNVDDTVVVQRTSEKCDRDNVSNAVATRDENGACKPEIEVSSELEVTLPEPMENISMNSLLSPLNQTYQETQDNNLDRKADDNCQEAVVHPNVKSQSTSPNIPCDSESYQLSPSDQSTPTNIDENLNQPNNDAKGAVNGTVNKVTTEKSQNTANPSYTGNKKDEIKILPAVVPVLSYTTAAPPNIYPPIDAGVQFVAGTQPTQPTSFPTTYQQGLDGSIYAVPQPMIYGYPTVQDNEYSGGIFVPMYDQGGAQVPVSTQQNEQNTTTTDYRRNCGVPLAFFEPPSTAMTVVPVAYPATSTAAPYGPSHNIYQGQILYTSDQYNPATASNSQVPQYINYPVGYTYPYNGAAYPYWGQAMTYYVPQTMQTQTTAIANNNTTNANSNSNNTSNNNNNDSNGNKAHIQSPHSIQPHPNTVAKTPLYASNSTNETKSITTPNAASQPNVFQYPPTMTSAPTSTSSTSITNSTTTNATNNSVAITSVQSLPNTSVSVSSSLPTNVGNDNPKLVSHVPNAGHPSHRTKNHQALLSTPNDSLKQNNPNANTDEPDSKEFSNHSSTNYERKKNLQNSNRKPYVGSGGGGGGPYRPNPNVGINNHNSNSLSINNPAGGQTNMSATNNPGIRKGPLIHHTIPESSGNTHIFTSGAGHHHNENMTPAYNRSNSTQNSSSAPNIEHSEKRPINHNKPLIATLPTLSNVHNHFDRTRAPRPKPLDLRRNASNRNTPSTNSTESNNSPNSIISSDQHHSQNHHQQQQIQTTSSYVSGTVNTSIMSQTGIQPNIGPRVVSSTKPKQVRMYHGDIANTNSDSLGSPSSALCGEPFAYNPHSGMYIKFGKTYIAHSMAFPNKAQQNDIRQSLPPITGIYPTMNMMLTGYPAAARPHTVGPRPSHVNPNFNKNNRTPR
ncbi:protein encore isoform X2 [Contarinia nasturtii]|uniref:protein encore isoform X2 n=1 Tax=Contarinia nasturtii TaxID=265458 RepID=UPI0012D48A97|nr:protein encore isoform X2 [Contarinia nasturtii]